MNRTAGGKRSRRAAARQRYVQRWRGTHPPGVFSVDYLRRPLSLPRRVHLRALVGWDQPLRAAAMAPATLWGLARWYVGGRSAAVERVPGSALDRYAGVAGMSEADLRTRLRAVLARHTVMPRDALRFGLVVDLEARSGEQGERSGAASGGGGDGGAAGGDGGAAGGDGGAAGWVVGGGPGNGNGTQATDGDHRPARTTDEEAWPLFIYDHEEGWNLAASMAITARGSLESTATGPVTRWRDYWRRVAATRSQIAALSDKNETARRLDAAGIPTVATLLVPAGEVAEAAGATGAVAESNAEGVASVAKLIERASAQWPTTSGFFAKPRAGSRGLDSFIITRAGNPGGAVNHGHVQTPTSAPAPRDGGAPASAEAPRDGDAPASAEAPRGINPPAPGESGHAEAPDRPSAHNEGPGVLSVAAAGDTWAFRHYQADLPTRDLATTPGISECLRSQDYLVQPLLRTARAWRDVAADSDVVTVRVVTRDVGGGAAVFSRVVEVPLPPEDRGQFYLLVAIDDSGRVGAPALPLREADAMSADTREAWERVTGRLVPWSADLDALAERAHRHFPGVFAVAWDIALTDDGPLFLEGNSGFGTFAPQMVAGGLLKF